MIETYLFTFAKRRNSTLQPNLNAGVEVEGEIKHDFTPLALAITFNLQNKDQIPAYNYAYIPDFSRYYYITDWVFIGGLWRASLTVDVLATYRRQIRASSQYVARAAGAKLEGLIDSAYPTIGGSGLINADQTLTQWDFWGTSQYPVSFDDGTIVLAVVNNSGANVGAITYYAMGVPGFKRLMSAMLSDISWANISVSEISDGLQKALINPMQYIASVMWIPLNAIQVVVNSGAPNADVVTDIKLGWWSFSIAQGGNVARILHSPFTLQRDYYAVKKYFDVQKSGQSNTRGQFLNLAPYAKYTLTFLPFGVIDVDSAELYGRDYLGVEVRIHLYTGDAVLMLYASNDNQGTSDKLITTINANVGVPLPIGQIAVDIRNIDSALTSAALMGASELAVNLSSAPVKAAPQTGSTTTNTSGFSHYSGKF